MHTDDFNKSSKIVDICIYILFIISYVLHILLDILRRLRSSLTLSAKGNYLLGYNFQQRCLNLSNLDLWNANKVACFILMTNDSYAEIRGILFSYWPPKKLRQT